MTMGQPKATNGNPFKVPATVNQVIDAPGGGKVEVTVEDDAIWLSNIDGSDKRTFTLRIARKALEGHSIAVRGIEERAAHAKTLGARAPRLDRDEDCAKAASASKQAGFWFVDERYTLLGTPVTVIDG